MTDEYQAIESFDQAEALKSVGASRIHERLEECFMYCRDKRHVFSDAFELGLSFGKYGTQRFFPLPLLVGLIDQDDRFKPYLADSKELKI